MPSPAPVPVSENYDEIKLTPEEIADALLLARKAKANRLRIEANRVDYERRIRESNQPITCTAEQLYQWVLVQAQEKMPNFTVDEWNQDILIQLSLYFTGDDRAVTDYDMDLRKGILLVGTTTGQGKTWLMRLFQQNPVCSYSVVSCLDVATDYQRHPDKGGGPAALDYYIGQSGPMLTNAFRHKAGGFCFDDLGVEPISKSMGNESNTMLTILQMRYNNFHRMDLEPGYRTTHITTNLDADQIETLYDARVRSRMREMFNMIELPIDTPDRRK